MTAVLALLLAAPPAPAQAPAPTQPLPAQGDTNVLLFCGGVIPDEDRVVLERAGYRGVFGPDTPLRTIVSFVQANARRRD